MRTLRTTLTAVPVISFRKVIIRVIGYSIPAIIFVAGAFLPLQSGTRQCLVGLTLVWLYTAVLSGFRFFV